VTVASGKNGNVTVTVNVPIVGSIKMSGKASVSKTTESVTIGSVRVSSTIGKVVSASSEITVANTNIGLVYKIDKALTIEKSLGIFGTSEVVDVDPGIHVIK